VRDFAVVEGAPVVDAPVADRGLRRLDVDDHGLDAMDRRYLKCIADDYGGGPVGIDALAAVLSDQRDAVEEVIEPFLIQQGLVQRTPRGRMLSDSGFRYLGLAPRRPAAQQYDLLGGAEDDA
jgi:Holliday junction DNA helicase RuvB